MHSQPRRVPWCSVVLRRDFTSDSGEGMPCSSCATLTHAKDSRATLVVGIGECMQKAKQRVRADWQVSFAREPRATLAASLEPERAEQFGSAVGAAGVVGQRAVETLGEDFARSSRHVAEPATRAHSKADRPAAPR